MSRVFREWTTCTGGYGRVHSIIVVVVVDGPETSISPSSLMNTTTHEKTLERERDELYIIRLVGNFEK